MHSTTTNRGSITFLKFLSFLQVFQCLFTTISATVNDFEKRDAVQTIVSGGQTWTEVGCFTDISVGRTLAATFFSDNNNMTVEKCIAFCKDQDFIFAGVEFGQECYCDSTIQFPGSLAPEPTDCSQGFACTGNSSETCGAPGRIQIFTNGGQAPVLVENVPNSAWAYQGCFTDSAGSRVLATPMAVPVGVTAETCTAACQTAGFTDAGLEDGRECWCDNTLGTTSTHVSDLDCRAVCVANHTEYCGNANRIALYHLFDDDGSGSGGGGGGAQNECVAQDMSNFTLVARFNTPPSNGAPQEIPLKVLLVEMVPSVTWTVLSACPLCCSDWPSFSMKDSVFLPHSLTNPGQLMVSTAPGPGESPNFVASAPAFPGFQSYCVMNGPKSATSEDSQQLLGFGGKSDAFSLCANNTMNGRLDVVFEPVTSHPHYTLDDCSPVTIEIVT